MTTTLSRPPLVVRVGITGHRQLGDDPALLKQLSDRLDAVLAAIRDEVDAIHDLDAREKCSPLYDPDQTPVLRLVSGLAAGADQFAANAALTAGWQLEAILPFAVEDFRKDFIDQDGHATTFGAASGMQYSDDLAAFDDLYRRTGEAHIELCGQRDSLCRCERDSTCLRNLAYLSVGQMIVRRCELLIAVWNGKCAEGVGGTADVIEFALRSGTRVVWIDPQQPAQWYWLSELSEFFAVIADCDDSHQSLQQDDAAIISGYLQHLLGAHTDDHHDAHVAGQHMDAAVSAACRWIAKPVGERHVTLQDLYSEQIELPDPKEPPDPEEQPKPKVPLWACLFNWLRDRWAFPAVVKPTIERPHRIGAESPPLMEPESHFSTPYDIVDGCANLYSYKYRSAYAAIFALGALALTAAIVAVAGFKLHGTGLELIALLGIAVIFIAERKHAWHRRWISYRLLAELLRHARYLAIIGHSLPTSGSPASEHASTPEERWVLAFLHAHSRATPQTAFALNPDRLRHVRDRVYHDLVKDQIIYHTKNKTRCYRIAIRQGAVANLLFGVTLLLVSIKLIFLGFDFGIEQQEKSVWLTGFGLAAGFLPVIGAALFAFRQQSEFEVLEQRSELMLKALNQASERLDKLGDCSQPMAAELLGQEIYALADLMISDLAEWSVVFKVKVVETA